MKSKPKIEESGFKKAINATIKEGRHVEYLEGVLEGYDWYCREFDKIFEDDPDLKSIYEFRIVYQLKKNVWRDIAISGGQTFEQLAKAIVKSMGFAYDHMHGFTFPGVEMKRKGGFSFERTLLEFFAPHWEDDPFPTYKSNQIKIGQVNYKKHPQLNFVFDFGDGHRFNIQYKDKGIKDSVVGVKKFPAVIGGKGTGPEQYPDWK